MKSKQQNSISATCNFPLATCRQAGFTLVETLVAIFILTVAVVGLMTVAKNDFYAVRYARNQMIATALMQEGLEYVRADRDTAFQQGVSWDDWQKTYEVNSQTGSGCFSKNGCVVDPYTAKSNLSATPVRPCGKNCPSIYYFPDSVLYAYAGDLSDSDAYATTFSRRINLAVSPDDSNQITVTSTVSWQNGNSPVSASQSTLLTNWQITQTKS